MKPFPPPYLAAALVFVVLAALGTFLFLTFPGDPFRSRPVDDRTQASGWNEDNTLSIEQVAPAVAANTANPSVRALEVSRESDPSGLTTIHFALINQSNSDIYYHGYSLDSIEPRLPEGRISPLYSLQTMGDLGWTDTQMNRCAMGATGMRIKPGHGGRFMHVHRDSAEARIRIGISYSIGETRNSSTAWSEQVVLP